VDAETCVPTVYGDRLRLPWVVDGLAEADPRLRGERENLRLPEVAAHP
jgi:hypothetical protein